MFDSQETADKKLVVFGIMRANVSDFFRTHSTPTTKGESAKFAKRLVEIHGDQDRAIAYWENVRDNLIREF